MARQSFHNKVAVTNCKDGLRPAMYICNLKMLCIYIQGGNILSLRLAGFVSYKLSQNG